MRDIHPFTILKRKRALIALAAPYQTVLYGIAFYSLPVKTEQFATFLYKFG